MVVAPRNGNPEERRRVQSCAIRPSPSARPTRKTRHIAGRRVVVGIILCGMEFTVQNVCGLLIKSKLLTADDVKLLYERWRKEAGDVADSLAAFTRWLVARQYVTAYQAALVAKGQTDSFFLHQY